MKRQLLCIASIVCLNLISNLCFGQLDYFANNPVWTVTSGCPDPYGTYCIRTDIYNYYVGGDTLINSLTYKKILKRGSFTHMMFGSNDTSCNAKGSYNNDLAILLRQVKKSIYAVYPGDTTIRLLYNFNLKIGDTVPASIVHYTNDTMIVNKIDSILVGNSYRKKFEINIKYGTTLFLIEGIGHRQGFLEPMSGAPDCGYRLNCFGINDTAYYPTKGTTCYLPLGIQNINPPIFSMNVFPNPATTAVTVKTSGTESYKILLINILGQTAYSYANISGQEEVVDISSLAKGLYVVSLQDRSGNVLERQKLIVQ